MTAFAGRHVRSIIIGAVAFFVGVGIGVSGAGNDSALEEERKERAFLAQKVAQFDEILDAEEQRTADAIRAKESAEREVEAELAGIARDKRELRGKLREADAQLDEVNAQVQEIESNTFTDGIWEVGADIAAGTYRAPGGGSCYWALLGSADTQDIVNNGGFSANQTISISSPYFETTNCGEWSKL